MKSIINMKSIYGDISQLPYKQHPAICLNKAWKIVVFNIGITSFVLPVGITNPTWERESKLTSDRHNLIKLDLDLAERLRIRLHCRYSGYGFYLLATLDRHWLWFLVPDGSASFVTSRNRLNFLHCSSLSAECRSPFAAAVAVELCKCPISLTNGSSTADVTQEGSPERGYGSKTHSKRSTYANFRHPCGFCFCFELMSVERHCVRHRSWSGLIRVFFWRLGVSNVISVEMWLRFFFQVLSIRMSTRVLHLRVFGSQ